MRSTIMGLGSHVIAVAMAVGGLCSIAPCQTASPAQPAGQSAPAYEVATIKPGQGFALTLRMYILSAFGMQLQSTAQLIGPDWISTTRYSIHGKPPDSLEEAMNKMTGKERDRQEQLMMQSLLADRFKLKYHIETRDLRGYQLLVAKGGPTMKEDPDATKARAMSRTNGLKGTAVTMDNLVMLLGDEPELEGYPLTNNTGLTGRYDIALNWTPLTAASSGNDAAASSSTDAPPLFIALQEELGLKLVVAKTPAKVVVIDHIELPSPN
jgi:uncharacterized protein (TIGR03435 family)